VTDRPAPGSPRPTIVVVGAAARDLTESDPRGWRLGGGVSYGALTTARLGLRTAALVGVDATAADAATDAGPVRRDYASSVGKVFTVSHAGRTHRLKLTAVQHLPHTHRAQRQQCFSLLFTPTGGRELPDGIYALKRTNVRTHSLFLCRVGTGRTLQAVVNRAH